jgi:crossover junction endodeoxyribonuclease RusA
MIVIVTPFPPSINHYYGNGRNGRKFIKAPGIEYRAAVLDYVTRYNSKAPEGRLSVGIQLYPPDKRRRDVDNSAKAALDALTHAGVYQDDCLIDDLRITRMHIVKGGMLRIFVSNHIPEPEIETRGVE